MNRHHENTRRGDERARFRPEHHPTDRSSAKSRTVGLASMLRPIRAQLKKSSGVGWRLTVSPALAHQAWCVATAFTTRADAAALLWTPPAGRLDAGAARRGLRQAALRRSVRPLDDLSDDDTGERITLTPEASNVLIDSLIDPDLHAVLVEGEIDARDADAMCDAALREESPLTQEIRAIAHLHATRGGPLVIESRDRDILVAAVAETLRGYASSRLPRLPRRLDRPPLPLIDRMIDRSGTVSIRPIETEVLPGSIDIGINTRPTSAVEPADWSLVYDAFAGSWHDADEVRR